MKNKRLTSDDLRKSILELAIEGKLVQQDYNDVPASQLIDNINEKRAQLLKDGKIKKDSKSSFIYKKDNFYYEKVGKTNVNITDELPFDIPSTWTWARLKSIADIFTGNSINEETKKKKYENQTHGLNYIGTKDISFDRKINYLNGIKIPNYDNFRIAPKDKILICVEGGSAGRKIAKLDENVCFGNKLACFNTFIDIDEYLYLFLQSPTFLAFFKNNLTGIISGISLNSLKNLLIPIPPLLEQKRIVEKFNLLDQKILQYDNYENEIYKIDSNIKVKLINSIYSYAIKGKLVKQDVKDVPANILLKQIEEEKRKLYNLGIIKKQKKYQLDLEKFNNLIIPKGWTICNLSSIISLTSGVDLTSSEYFDNERLNSVPYITGASNIDNNIIKINRYTDSKFINSHLNDILLTCKGTIGKIVINNIGDVHVARQIMSIKSFINNEFLILLLNANIGKIKSNAKSLIPGINRDDILGLPILLPPIEEQKRIVDKVKILLSKL